MTSYSLFLLPGDGIGPEVMAEVEKVIAALQADGAARFELDRGLVGGAAYDAHAVAISDADMAKAQAADAVLLGAVGGPQVGRRALRGAARGRPAAPAQGHAALRQPAPGDLLPGPGRRLVAEARTRRRARSRDRARTDRRRLFRRTEGDHRPRQRPEARRRHAGLRDLRDRAHRPRRLRAGPAARQQADCRRRSAT